MFRAKMPPVDLSPTPEGGEMSRDRQKILQQEAIKISEERKHPGIKFMLLYSQLMNLAR